VIEEVVMMFLLDHEQLIQEHPWIIALIIVFSMAIYIFYKIDVKKNPEGKDDE